MFLPSHLCLLRLESPLSFNDTLKSLNEHARLAFLEFFSTILSFFHVINEKFHLTRLLIYLVNKQTGCLFSPPYSFILVCLFIRDLMIERCAFSFIHYFWSFSTKSTIHKWTNKSKTSQLSTSNNSINEDNCPIHWIVERLNYW